MSWFRYNIRTVARLALLALMFQMAVSFGHMHSDDLGLPPFAASDRTSAAFNTAPSQASPADQNQQPASDDYCPICASMALLATGMPALPPVFVAPAVIDRVWPAAAPAQIFSPQVAYSFQARAPPTA
jgi:hypothetical protein